VAKGISAAGIWLAWACIAQAADPGIKVGLLETMFADVPKPVLNAMAEPFRSLMMRQTQLQGDVEICRDFQFLASKLKDKSITVGVFHGYEYAWAKHADTALEPLLVTVPHGRKAQSMIVVRKDAEVSKVADLKDKPVCLCKGTKAYSRLYLDRLKATHKEITLSPKPATMTPEEALNAVASGSEAATLTDASILTGYQLLQPGVYAQLRILHESELFPCSVIATNKGSLTDEERAKLVNGLAAASKTAQGRAMLGMWGLKGFEKVPEGYDDHCKKIMAAYPPPKN
jgi:ABC-type phosphate/phosphonate transport system substrate-binding protein